MNRRDALLTASTAIVASSTFAGSSHADAGLKGPPSRVSADVIATLHTQAKRWTAGDLEGFCAVYADDALFLSPSGLTRGRAEVLARYQKKYVDGPEGKAGMGALSFAIEDARSVSTIATVALRWTLTWPEAMKKATATGLSLVTLENGGGGTGDKARWLILHDASM